MPSRRLLTESLSLDACVPGIAGLGRRGAQTLSEVFERIGGCDVVDELHVLVAELAGDAQAKRAAEGDREVPVVHAPGEERLRVQGVGHVDAVPPAALDGVVDEVTRLRQDPGGVEHVDERGADPLGDVGPALFAGDLGDLAAKSHAAEIGDDDLNAGHQQCDEGRGGYPVGKANECGVVVAFGFAQFGRTWHTRRIAPGNRGAEF